MFVICHKLVKADSDGFLVATFPRIDSSPSIVIICHWLVSDGFQEKHGCCCCCFREVMLAKTFDTFLEGQREKPEKLKWL